MQLIIGSLGRSESNTLLGNSFSIFIIRLLPSLANLLVMIWYSRQLPPALYGDYQNFWVGLYIFYPLACMGIHVLMFTYPQAFIVHLLRRIKARYYGFYFLWLSFLSIVFALLQHSSLQVSFIISFLFLSSFSLSVLLESFLLVSKKYLSLIVVNVAYSIAYIVIHIYILNGHFSIPALFASLLIITVARFLIDACIAIQQIIKQGDNFQEEYDLGKIKSLWVHLGFYDVTQLLFSWIDKFIMSFILTAALSAEYFNGSVNIPLLPLLFSAVGSALLMQLASGNKDEDKGMIIAYNNRSASVVSCIIFPAFFFLFFFRYELFHVVLTDKYATAVPIFAMSVLSLPLRAYSFTSVLQHMHKGKIINIGAILDLLLACALIYPLYKLMGLPGAALSFVITTYLQAGYYLIYTAKSLQVSVFSLLPFKDWLTKLAILGILFSIAHYYTSIYCTPLAGLIYGILISMIAVGATLLLELRKKQIDL